MKTLTVKQKRQVTVVDEVQVNYTLTYLNSLDASDWPALRKNIVTDDLQEFDDRVEFVRLIRADVHGSVWTEAGRRGANEVCMRWDRFFTDNDFDKWPWLPAYYVLVGGEEPIE